MDERVEKWLYDIRFAIEEIDGYFENSGRNKVFITLHRNLKRKVSVLKYNIII